MEESELGPVSSFYYINDLSIRPFGICLFVAVASLLYVTSLSLFLLKSQD